MKYKSTVRLKRTVSFAAAMAMAVSAVPIMPAYAETGTKSYVYDKYKIDYTVNSKWFGKQNVSVTLTNTSDEPILNWALGYDAQGDIDDIWNGYVFYQNGEDYIIKNMGYNYEIAPYQSVTYGYVLSTSDYVEPESFNLCSKRVDKVSGYDVKLNVTGDWGEGFQGEIILTNTSDAPIEAWELSFDTNFVINNLWGGKILNAEDNSYTLASEMWTNPIAPGSSEIIGFIGSKDASVNPDLSGIGVSEIVIDGTASEGEEDIPDIFITADAVYSEENSNIVLSWNTNVEKGIFDVLYSTDNIEYITVDTVKNTHSYVIPADELAGTVYFKVIQTVKDRIGESAVVSVDIPVPVVKVTPEITLSAEYNAETGYIDVLWSSTVADGTFDILTSYNDCEYESAAVVSETSSYSFAPENAGEYSIKTVQTTSAGVTGESNAAKVTVPETEAKEPDVDPEIDWEDETDTDSDGLPDVYENNYFGTDPENPDSDSDGLPDGYEVLNLRTDPLKADSDDNGVNDSDEDFDKDGLNNLREYELGTDPASDDTDYDGLSDGDEVNKYNTNPLKFDTDGDGVSDGDEIALGLDPNNAATDGTPDSERTFSQHIGVDAENFSDINKAENPFKVSIDIVAAGAAENNLESRESGYSKAIRNDAIIGITPEFTYTDGLKVEDVVINFDLENSVVNNTNGKYTSVSDEFVGIKRLNVFKFFEDTNMLLPIETFHDVENNRVYTHVDELGTYCLMDMEIWLDNLGIEADGYSTANVQASTASSNDGGEISLTEEVKETIDVVMVIYSDRSMLDEVRHELKVTSQDLFIEAKKENKDLRIYFLTFLGTPIISSGGTAYVRSYSEAESVIERCVGITSANKASEYPLHKAMNYIKNNYLEKFRENSERYCIIIDACGAPTVSTTGGAIQTLKENGVKFSFSYNRANPNESSYKVISEGVGFEQAIIGGGRYQFDEFVFRQIFGNRKSEYPIISAVGWKVVRLDSPIVRDYYNYAVSIENDPSLHDGVIKLNKFADSDKDGLLDLEEIMFRTEKDKDLITFDDCGNAILPNFEDCTGGLPWNRRLFYVKDGLKRYADTKTFKDFFKCRILPIKSDPNSKDSDYDGLLDFEDYYSLEEKYTNILIYDPVNENKSVQIAGWDLTLSEVEGQAWTKDFILKSIDSMSITKFLDLWDTLDVAENGKKYLLGNVVIKSHGTPLDVCLDQIKLVSSQCFDYTYYKAVYGENALDISKLKDIKIKNLYLFACNCGNLDFIYNGTSGFISPKHSYNENTKYYEDIAFVDENNVVYKEYEFVPFIDNIAISYKKSHLNTENVFAADGYTTSPWNTTVAEKSILYAEWGNNNKKKILNELKIKESKDDCVRQWALDGKLDGDQLCYISSITDCGDVGNCKSFYTWSLLRNGEIREFGGWIRYYSDESDPSIVKYKEKSGTPTSYFQLGKNSAQSCEEISICRDFSQ